MDIKSRIIGALIISVPMLLLAFLGAMGGGDIKLMAVVGLCVGYKEAVFITLLGAVLGTVVYIISLFTKNKIGKLIPFGTFLSIATIISIFYGSEIINWYLNI